MKTALREEEVIRFMTRAPQVHMMEIIGVNDFDLEKAVGKTAMRSSLRLTYWA